MDVVMSIGLDKAAALVSDDENLKFPVQETDQAFRPEQESVKPGDSKEKSLLYCSRYSIRRVSTPTTPYISATSEDLSWSTEGDSMSSQPSLNVAECEALLYLSPAHSSDNPDYSFVAGLEKQLMSAEAFRRSRTSSLGSNPFTFGSTESKGDELVFEEPPRPVLIRRTLQEYLVQTGDTCKLKTRYIATLPDSIFNGTFITFGHHNVEGVPEYVDRHRLIHDPANFKAARDMFLSELEAMSRLNHPNIVPLIGGHSYEAYDGLHLVLRQGYAGHPVKQFYCPDVGEERGSKIRTRQLMTQLLGFWQAMAHMKKQKVLHRDICPDNLMMLDGKLVLIDFDQATDCRIGFPRDFSGRQFYAAPETQQLKTQDYTADVFSAAVTCLKLLEWQGYIDPDSMKRIAVEKREKVGKKIVKTYLNGISPVLKDPVPVEVEQLFEVLVQCVDINPVMRPSAESMVAEMKQFIDMTINDSSDTTSGEDDDDHEMGMTITDTPDVSLGEDDNDEDSLAEGKAR